ncbi:MAG TPA: DUF4832 domain-containing protein [Ferruginibacter sp.]|nr:DUF4832 domain-containing protein [Ferruginibacter sp.]HMP21784.1 DUF4832 domain-containing protein [Ferruginibacter sp.]
MKHQFLLRLSLLILILLPRDLRAQHVVLYTQSGENFANPERGLYKYTITNNTYYTATGYSNLSENTLNGWRNDSDKVSVIYRTFRLDQFLNTDIPANYLENIQLDFDVIRNAGFTCIVRFAYSQAITAQPQQPVKSRILTHIQQVAPVLQRNQDVILAYQAGFIGTWGEWYYTNSAEFGTEGNINATQWQNRKEIVDAMLSSTPPGMFVLLRYPSLKINMYGATPLNDNTAYQNTASARLGFYNDAFLNNWGDMGTYRVNSETQNPVGTPDYIYLSNESKYSPMVGETNGVNAPRTNGSNALVELEHTNWSVLNRDYFQQVFTNWINSGHYAEIVKRMGYRIHLIQSVFTLNNNTLDVTIKLKNSGFARPFKNRWVKLIFKNTGTGNAYPFLVDTDFRTWSDTIHLNKQLDVGGLPFGNYAAFLQIADTSSLLADNSKYAVQLANTNVWIDHEGMNDLQQSFTHTATPAQYTFIGSGNWSLESNWLNNQKPPAVLPAQATITIDPAEGTSCILNTSQTIAPGATITVAPGKQLLIEGFLTIQ